MFTPQAVWARDFLKDRKDPPKSVRWWPAHSFVSCDGRTAVNTGPWIRPDNSHGYFTTVWQRTGGQVALGLRWRRRAKGAAAEAIPAADPSCGLPRARPRRADHPAAAADAPRQARTTPEDNGRGESADKTSRAGTGRSTRRASAISASICGTAPATHRCSTTTFRAP